MSTKPKIWMTSVVDRSVLFFILALLSLVSSAAQYSLTVENGSGSGFYEEGSSVYVWANPQENPEPTLQSREPLDATQPMRMFDRWVGDTAHVADVGALQTKVLMPAADVTITAQYKDAQRWLPVTAITRFPPNQDKGVIFMFHGGYGGAKILLESPEVRSFVEEATSRGFGAVALDSYDRHARKWDKNIAFEENFDMARVVALRQSLIDEGKMTELDPVYLYGISGGGLFASLWDQNAQVGLGFPVKATALIVSNGTYEIMLNSTAATIFAIGRNDPIVTYNAALTSFNYLLENGALTQLYVSEPTPLYPEIFWRIEGIDAIGSQAIFQALVDAGAIDAEGSFLVTPSQIDLALVVPVDYIDFLYDIEQAILMAYADHTPMAHFNKQILDFFENPTTVVDLAPQIDTIDPEAGTPGMLVTIRGNNFVDLVSVDFNGTPVDDYLYINASEIRASVPVGATTGPINITNPAGTGTSPVDFVVGGPEPTGFSPDHGGPGTLVTVNGSGFVDVTDVRFNGVSAESITSLGPNALLATVPELATTGPISVTNYVGTGTTTNDFVVPPPTIDGFTPASGRPGTLVTVSGQDMVRVSGVHFNGEPAVFTCLGPNSLIATVPDLATTGPISVTNPVGTGYSTDDFSVSPPQIASFTPLEGIAGTLVTIQGVDMVNLTEVRFNDVPAASFTSIGPTTILATVPVLATTGPITVVNEQGAGTSSDSFVVRGPEIYAIDPTAGNAGDTVTIDGAFFVNLSSVSFNGVEAASFQYGLLGKATTQIKAVVPDGATTGPIVLTNPQGSATSPGDFLVVGDPTVTGMTPTSGPVGTSVSITGENLGLTTEVLFCSTAASFQVIGDTQITTVVPVLDPAFCAVKVTTPVGTVRAGTFRIK